MFIALLALTFVVSLVVCHFVTRYFRSPIDGIMKRLVADDVYAGWTRYMVFAIYVVGVSGGVKVRRLTEYMAPDTLSEESSALPLTWERWTTEIYRTIIETLQSVAWMLLIFFLFALIAYVIVKGFELKRSANS